MFIHLSYISASYSSSMLQPCSQWHKVPKAPFQLLQAIKGHPQHPITCTAGGGNSGALKHQILRITFRSSSLWYLWRPNPLADYSWYTSETYSLELSIARGPRQLNERTIISSFFLGLKFEPYMWYIWVCLKRPHLQQIVLFIVSYSFPLQIFASIPRSCTNPFYLWYPFMIPVYTRYIPISYPSDTHV